MKTDPRRVATIEYRDVDSIVADATRLFGLTHRGLKPTAKVIRWLHSRLCDMDIVSNAVGLAGLVHEAFPKGK